MPPTFWAARHEPQAAGFHAVRPAGMLAPMDTAVFLNHDHMGHGDAELGTRILKTFLQKSRALRGFETVLLANSGVRLVAADSPVLAELRLLEENGIDVVPCATCLAHYEVEPAVGEVGSMDAIIATLDKAAKVITL